MRAKVRAFFMIVSPKSIAADMPLIGILSSPNALAKQVLVARVTLQRLEAAAAAGHLRESLRWPLPTGDPLPRFDQYPPFILLHPFARGDGKSLSNAVIEEFCSAFAPTRVVVVGQSRRKIDTPGNCVSTSACLRVRIVRMSVRPPR